MTASAPGGSPSARGPVLPPRTSALAISGLAAAGLVAIAKVTLADAHLVGLSAVASLAVALVAARQIRRSRGREVGLSLALTAVLFSCTLLAWTALNLYQDWMFDRATGRANLVERDLMRITSACWKYSARHGHSLPPAASWRDVFEAEGFLKKGSIGAPGDDGPRHYAMNSFLGDLKMVEIKECAKTVLFFECAPGTPQAGGPGNFRRDTPYAASPRGHVIAFADGHCEYRKAADVDGLKWLPRNDLRCPQCGEAVWVPNSWTPEEPFCCPLCLYVLWDPDGPSSMPGIWDRHVSANLGS